MNPDIEVGKAARFHREKISCLVASDFSDQEVQESFHEQLGGQASANSISRLRFALLRYLVDDERSNGIWEYLIEAQPKIDRDESILKLWFKVRLADLKKLQGELWSARYYEDRLFVWYLSRFDPGKARELLRRRHQPVAAHFVLGLLLALVCVALPCLWLCAPWSPAVAAVACYALILLLLPRFLSDHHDKDKRRSYSELLVLAAQSLVPRLGAAVIVGWIAVASFAEVPRWGASGWGLVGTAVVLVISALYLALLIARKVQPRTAGLMRRWAAVGSCGLAHAIAVALVGLTVAHTVQPQDWPAPSPGEVISWAVWSLAVGLVLNVIWDETPVTKPL